MSTIREHGNKTQRKIRGEGKQSDRQTGKHISGAPRIIWNVVKTEVREAIKYE